MKFQDIKINTYYTYPNANGRDVFVFIIGIYDTPFGISMIERQVAFKALWPGGWTLTQSTTGFLDSECAWAEKIAVTPPLPLCPDDLVRGGKAYQMQTATCATLAIAPIDKTVKKYPACQCGVDKVGGNHSYYCEKYTR